MNNIIHIITPFSRYDNKTKFINHLIQFKDNIILHPIELGTLTDWSEYDWIKPICMQKHDPNWDYCYEKINYFINNNEIIDDEYYSFMNDDDGVESSYYDTILKYNTDIILTSMKRGIRKPVNGLHGISTLYAKKELMGLNRSGLGQVILKGHILKNLQFINYSGADGVMVEHLLKTDYTKTYLIDTFSLFNLFEPGRY